MKNKGFSLLEVCIGIALIGIMISIGGPKIRKYIASGKDTRTIATLSTLRTASELYYTEKGEPVFDKEKDDITDAIKKLRVYLDPKTYRFIENGKLEIGGSRKNDDLEAPLNYGGEVQLTFINPNDTEDAGDGIYIWLEPEQGQEYDSKGQKWSEY